MAEGYALVQGRAADAGVAAAAAASRLTHGVSAMQKRGARHGRVGVEAPATSRAFAAKAPGTVRDDDRFLHVFFRTKAAATAEAEAAAAAPPAAGDAAGAADEDAEEEAFAQKLAEARQRDFVSQISSNVERPAASYNTNILSNTDENDSSSQPGALSYMHR